MSGDVESREGAADQQLTAAIKGEGVDRAPGESRADRGKRRVERARSREDRDVAAGHAGDRRERPADHETAVAQQHERGDRGGQGAVSKLSIVGEVGRAIGIKPGKGRARHSADLGRDAAHENLAVGLHGDGIHHAVGIITDKGRIERAVEVQPGHAARRNAPGRVEITADDELAIRLQGRGADDTVKPRRSEPGVEGAIEVEPRDA